MSTHQLPADGLLPKRAPAAGCSSTAALVDSALSTAASIDAAFIDAASSTAASGTELRADDLTKSYAGRTVLRGIDLHVGSGQADRADRRERRRQVDAAAPAGRCRGTRLGHRPPAGRLRLPCPGTAVRRRRHCGNGSHRRAGTIAFGRRCRRGPEQPDHGRTGARSPGRARRPVLEGPGVGRTARRLGRGSAGTVGRSPSRARRAGSRSCGRDASPVVNGPASRSPR